MPKYKYPGGLGNPSNYKVPAFAASVRENLPGYKPKYGPKPNRRKKALLKRMTANPSERNAYQP